MALTHFSGPVDSVGGFKVNGTEVINSSGELIAATSGRRQYTILKPEVGAGVIVNAEDISGGDVATCTLVRTILDYPRNLLYTLSDAASDTLIATFTVVGTDQFGDVATEVVIVDYDAAATMPGSQIFATITSVAISATAGEAASDTASVGVNITADVASFGLPAALSAVTDVKSVNWVDNGTSKTQNIDATSVVIARDCFRPEQTVAAADDYVIMYEPS